MSYLPRADKEQCGAFLVIIHPHCIFVLLTYPFQRDERVLIVWSDNLDAILSLCHDFEDKLIKLVWRSRLTLPSSTTASSSVSPSYAGSEINLTEKTDPVKHGGMVIPDRGKPPPKKKMMNWSWKISQPETAAPCGSEIEKDEEIGKPAKPPRPIRLLAPFYGGLGAALAVCELAFSSKWNSLSDGYIGLLVFIANGLSLLLQEFRLDGRYVRFALLATTPFIFCVSLVRSRPPLVPYVY